MWSLPLFLYASQHNSDSVLLSTGTSLTSFGADYALVNSEPIAFAQEYTEMPIYPLVSLKTYWSEERKDLQTTTWSLAELNAHGGNYSFVSNVGLLLGNLTGGVESASYVPLYTSYDKDRTDALTAPLSSVDLNLYSPLAVQMQLDGSSEFSEGHLAGFAAKATCGELCSVGMSETFPSSGGADCYYECASGQSCYAYGYRVGEIESPQARAFDFAMRRAGEILQTFGDIDVTYGDGLHISLNYFCCYSPSDMAVIKDVLAGVQWPLLNVTFDQPTWRIDSDAEEAAHYSIIVMLDEPSQRTMLDFVGEIEALVRAAGVDIHVPRSDQEPFHSTLGVAKGLSYPSVAALQAVNAEFPPGSWTAAGAITLNEPRL